MIKCIRLSLSMGFLAAIALLMSGCLASANDGHWVAKDRQATGRAGEASAIPPLPDSSSVSNDLTDPDRQYVRTGTAELAVDSIEPAMRALHDVVKKNGGYVESLQTASLTIRIPAARFEAVLDTLPTIGSIVKKDIQIVDVTDHYSDREAELANLVALKTRLKALLSKATTVEDTLGIERELVRVQTKIDQLTGRLKRMKKQVAYAKLSIRLTERNDGTETTTLRAAGWLQEIGLSNLFQ